MMPTASIQDLNKGLRGNIIYNLPKQAGEGEYRGKTWSSTSMMHGCQADKSDGSYQDPQCIHHTQYAAVRVQTMSAVCAS